MALIKRTVTRPWCDRHAFFAGEWPPASGWAGWDPRFAGGHCEELEDEVLAGMKAIREELFGVGRWLDRNDAVLWTSICLIGDGYARLVERGDPTAQILRAGTHLRHKRTHSDPCMGYLETHWSVANGPHARREIELYLPDYGNGRVADAMVDLALAPIDVVPPDQASAEAVVRKLHALVTDALKRRVRTIDFFEHHPYLPVSV